MSSGQAGVESGNRAFVAFLSYRHEPPDETIAARVHASLETYRPPRAVLRRLKLATATRRIFLDREELAIGRLTDDIRAALEAAPYLIVLCSPRAAGSRWISAEIEDFLKGKDVSRVLPILLEGTPESSFPPELLARVARRLDSVTGVAAVTDLLAADLRGRDQRPDFRKWRTERLRVLARLLGCTYDELRRREAARQRKRAVIVSALVAGALTAIVAINARIEWKRTEIRKVNPGDVARVAVLSADRVRMATSRSEIEMWDSRESTLLSVTPGTIAPWADGDKVSLIARLEGGLWQPLRFKRWDTGAEATYPGPPDTHRAPPRFSLCGDTVVYPDGTAASSTLHVWSTSSRQSLGSFGNVDLTHWARQRRPADVFVSCRGDRLVAATNADGHLLPALWVRGQHGPAQVLARDRTAVEALFDVLERPPVVATLEAAASGGADVSLWSLETGALLRTRALPLPTFDHSSGALLLAPDGRSLVIIVAYRALEVLDTSDLSTRVAVTLGGAPPYPWTGALLSANAARQPSLPTATSAQHPFLLWSERGESWLWRLSAAEAHRKLEGLRFEDIAGAQMSPTGEWLLLRTRTTDYELWDAVRGHRIAQIGGAESPFAHFTMDGSAVAVPEHGTVRLVSAGDGSPIGELKDVGFGAGAIYFDSERRAANVWTGENRVVRYAETWTVFGTVPWPTTPLPWNPLAAARR